MGLGLPFLSVLPFLLDSKLCISTAAGSLLERRDEDRPGDTERKPGGGRGWRGDSLGRIDWEISWEVPISL